MIICETCGCKTEGGHSNPNHCILALKRERDAFRVMVVRLYTEKQAAKVSNPIPNLSLGSR